uniref:Rab-GAP TBC domain-containing protein n=1 Tax=Palpitomonas bilix TaxID=652834 RepID=A0A7S3D0Z2_9EUKA
MAAEAEEEVKYDSFQFRLDEEEAIAFEKNKPDLVKLLAEQEERWKVTQWDLTDAVPHRHNKLKKLIRGGVPGPLRAKVWMNVSGANAIRASSKLSYIDYCHSDSNKDGTILKQIDLDVPRTFTDRDDFCEKDGAMQKSLRRVLVAYANRNTGLGYCQGLNFLAGGFLIAALSEEEAFWLLCATIENLLPQNYFENKLQGLRTDALVLFDMLRRKVPVVFKVVEEGQISPEVLFSQWLLCMFSTVFPCQTFMRIWDSFFYEGVKVLFRACIAYLQRIQKIADVTSVEGVLRYVYQCKAVTFDTEVFVDEMFNRVGSFPWAHIEKLREKNGAKVTRQELTFSLMRAKLGKSSPSTPREKMAAGNMSFHRR